MNATLVAGALRVLCLALLLAMTPPATAAAPADDDAALFAQPQDATKLGALLGALRDELGRAQGVRGSFTQRKHLAGLPQPLTSSGEFLVARGLGIRWHTKVPFESELLLTSGGLVQREAGRESLRLSAAQQPGLAAFATLFYELFALDLPRLAERFTLYGAGNASGWRLGLKPRDTAVAGQLHAVIIRGGLRVEEVRLLESGGDRTEILLDSVAVPKLSEAEQQLFLDARR